MEYQILLFFFFGVVLFIFKFILHSFVKVLWRKSSYHVHLDHNILSIIDAILILRPWYVCSCANTNLFLIINVLLPQNESLCNMINIKYCLFYSRALCWVFISMPDWFHIAYCYIGLFYILWSKAPYFLPLVISEFSSDTRPTIIKVVTFSSTFCSPKFYYSTYQISLWFWFIFSPLDHEFFEDIANIFVWIL